MTPWLSRAGFGDAPTMAIVFDSRRIVSGSRTTSGYARRMGLRAVVFDVDFTIAQPGPDLGPEGYRGSASGTASSSIPRATTKRAAPRSRR